MAIFKLHSKYAPAGDQPEAIAELVQNVKDGMQNQVLQGVTGAGKTFTIANVIKEFDRPVLVLSHNKTLASQLYSELQGFFPENKVEYFVSYFDYYRPESYLPSKDVYIEKTSQTNRDLDAMRMSTINSVLTRPDTIVVASVSAIYGALNPEEYFSVVLPLKVGMQVKIKDFISNLVRINFKRNDVDLDFGTFSVKGDIVYIQPADNGKILYRVDFFGDEIDAIKIVDPLTKEVIENRKDIRIFPGDAYTVNRDIIGNACDRIMLELEDRIAYFEKNNQLLEAQRIKERTLKDVDSLREFGICSGVENYSVYMDQRELGQRPYTLLDYFKGKNPLVIIDESHMMLPQLRGMYEGDRSRKQNLVDYGFRLPSALDNRPLKFHEFESEFNYQTIYVSATPGDYELDKTYGVITRLFIRPTGLLDPIIEVRPTNNQIENIYDEVQKQKEKNERTIILTTTKRMAEELTRHFLAKNEKVAYIHSEHQTFERNEILRKLRKGVYDTVIGVNLLREGIDLPEVSLIVVLDADKDGYLRNTRSLIQIAGRAARNANGRVIFYADKITKSMAETIQDNKNKRKLQDEYNKKHNIVPKTIIKDIPDPIQGSGMQGEIELLFKNTADQKVKKPNKQEIIDKLRQQMEDAAKVLDYEKAQELRDLIFELQGTK